MDWNPEFERLGPAPGEGWRGSEHLEPWPEELAGPEYWLYRRREDVERAVIELVGEPTAREGS